jgi:ribosomal protein S18 acetylase RimI-like enzyme
MMVDSTGTDLHTFRGDAVRAWRTGGWVALKEEVRERMHDRVGGYLRGFVVEADLSRLVDVPPPPRVDIRVFTGTDWSLLGDLARGRLAGQFDQAAAAGQICLVAWEKRQAVGYAWFSDSGESHSSDVLPLPVDAIYITHLEVRPRSRGAGVVAALLSAGLRFGRERGFGRGWIVVARDNTTPIGGLARVAPSRVLGTLARLKVLAWMRSWYRPLGTPVPIVLSAAQ